MDGHEVSERTTSWRNNTSIDNERDDCQSHVDIEECDDFLAAWNTIRYIYIFWEPANLPTAVNLDLTCKIIITVMTSAIICINEAAPSKIIVLANSIFRA